MVLRYILGLILVFSLFYCSSAQDTEEESSTQEATPTEQQPQPSKDPAIIRTGNETVQPPQEQPQQTQVVKKEPNQVFEEMEKVYFSQGTTSLSVKNMFLLDGYVKYLRDNTSVSIKVNGYTDYTSNPEINQIISQMRADSVRNYLIQNGIAPKRVVAKGKGVYNPKSPYRDKEGMKKSRTVEFVGK